MHMRVRLEVNGRRVAADVETRRSLADFLREDLALTGTRLGCEQGVCGSCTVLLDDLPVRSCLVFAVQADGTRVLTVESLAPDGELHPLQQAFHEAGALQCGFCTAGLLMTALPIYDRGRPCDAEEVREAIGGNLCRCTGYVGVVEALTGVLGSRHDR
jgi:aerobic-type carbon monoxide dehydrogenase small subunit (CoxS/CutS family)